jgi:O-antigen ligase
LPVVALLGAKYGVELIQRVSSQASSADVNDLSSGRLDLWWTAINRMMESPVTLISGFGWNVYDSMGFPLVPHNHYILLWFELGLIGLSCYLLVISSLFSITMGSLRAAAAEERSYLLAFLFALIVLSVSICFEQLYKPWLYIWPYSGLALRAAVASRHRRVTASPNAGQSLSVVAPIRRVASRGWQDRAT